MTRTNSPTGWLTHATANSPLLYRLNIHRRLTLCFILVIVLMLVGDGVLLWQLHLIRAQVERLNGVDEELIEVLRVHTGLLSVYERLSISARSEDSARLQKDSETLRTGLLDEVQRTQAAFNRLPPEVKVDPTVLPTLESIERTLPSQLGAIRALAASEEWEAVRYRLERQVQPLESLSSELLEDVAREVGEQRTQAALNIARAERRMFLAVPITGFLTLLIAAGLGAAITRSITEPLGRLIEGSKALASGDFSHRVPAAGKDEIARLGSVFNDMIVRLEELYRELHSREAYLAEAQRLSRTGSFGWNVCSREIYWTAETFRIFEHEPTSKVTFEHIMQRTHPDDMPVVQQLIERVSRERTEFDFEHRLLMPDGSVKYLRVIGSPSESEDGCFEFVGAVTDITERKRAEQTLRESQASLQFALDTSEMGEWELDVAGRAAHRSLRHDRIFGYETLLPEWTYEKFMEHVLPEDRQLVDRKFRQALEAQSGWNFECRIVRSDQAIRWIRASGRPRLDAHGKLKCLAGIVQDITERKRAESELLNALEEIKKLRDQLYNENIVLREEIDRSSMFEEIVGSSPSLQEVIARVSKVAPTDSTVLITGETGTGKELIARAIHRRSRRSTRAFVSVNCGAISAGLVESELFGHIKGAFTGAIANRDGRFKVADGGTIFLDEVGDLPPETQVKLLRVLQEREFQPIGSNKTVKVDVRVLAATNRNLDDDVRAGKFRSDLLYRLNVFPIHVPPLRERREDIPLLVAFLLQTFAQKLGKNVTQVRDGTIRRLVEYSWPGNVRELQNILERAVILSTNNVLVLDREFSLEADGAPLPAQTASEAPESIASGAPSDSLASSVGGASLRDAERRHIESALAATNWVIEGEKGAARILDIHPNTLRSRMKKLDIHRLCGEAADGESAYRVKPPS